MSGQWNRYKKNALVTNAAPEDKWLKFSRNSQLHSQSWSAYSVLQQRKVLFHRHEGYVEHCWRILSNS